MDKTQKIQEFTDKSGVNMAVKIGDDELHLYNMKPMSQFFGRIYQLFGKAVRTVSSLKKMIFLLK